MSEIRSKFDKGAKIFLKALLNQSTEEHSLKHKTNAQNYELSRCTIFNHFKKQNLLLLFHQHYIIYIFIILTHL